MQKLFISILLLINSINLTHTAISKPSIPEQHNLALEAFINHILFTTKWGLTETLTLDVDNDKHWISDKYTNQEILLQEQESLLLDIFNLIKTSKELYKQYHEDIQTIYTTIIKTAKQQYKEYKTAKLRYLLLSLNDDNAEIIYFTPLKNIQLHLDSSNLDINDIQNFQIISNKINELNTIQEINFLGKTYRIHKEFITNILRASDPSNSYYLEILQIFFNTNLDEVILCHRFLIESVKQHRDILMAHKNFNPNTYVNMKGTNISNPFISLLELVVYAHNIYIIKEILHHNKFQAFHTTTIQTNFMFAYQHYTLTIGYTAHSPAIEITTNCNIVERAKALAEQVERQDVVDLLNEYLAANKPELQIDHLTI